MQELYRERMARLARLGDHRGLPPRPFPHMPPKMAVEPEPEPQLPVNIVFLEYPPAKPIPQPAPADPMAANGAIKVGLTLRVVAQFYRVSKAEITGSHRNAGIVRPRQVAMYLARTLTKTSSIEIGRRFGNKDHTTVLHAVRKIARLIETDDRLREEIELLTARLREVK